jgi:hypothetical protein
VIGDGQPCERRRGVRGWTPSGAETLIDRLSDPARALTTRGKVQLGLWIVAVALLVWVLSNGRDHAWAALAALSLTLLIGTGIGAAGVQLWRAARVMHAENRLWLPDLAWPSDGSPTTFVALGMVVVAAAVAMGYFRYGWLTAWAPNVVVGALTIAITVTVVDQAFRATESRRVRLLREPAMRQISEDLHDYLLTEANGLAVADPYRLPREPMQSPVGWMDLFIDVVHEGAPTSVEQHSRRADQLIANAEQLHSRLDRVRTRNGAVLDPELMASIDGIPPEVERAARWAVEAKVNVREPYEALKEASSRTLRAVRDVVECFEDCGGKIPVELFGDIWAKAAAYAERRRAALDVGQRPNQPPDDTLPHRP